jgi:GDP-L-fucose synthase
MKKKLLILGATGFIGKNLLSHYSKNKNYEIYCTYFKSKKIKINGINWIRADLRKPQIVNKIIKGKDIVIQAAATTSGSKVIINSPQLHVTDNAIMNSIILRACHENFIKHFIFFSCTVMYPHSNKYLNESYQIDPNKINKKYYGVANTKLYIEKMCKFYSLIGKTKFTCIRHSNVYGPHDKFELEKSHFFSANVTKILESKNNKITIWGDGKEKRDLLYIDDLLNFVKLAISKQKNNFEIYNCGYGKSFKVIDIIKQIIKTNKRKITIYFDKSKPSIKTNILITSTKAKKDLGWTPKTSLQNGIYKTIKWYKENNR